MHNKKINQLFIGAALATMAPAVNAAQTPAWNGSVLGFEAGQPGLLGDMLGIRPILEENGFHYNLGYLNEMATTPAAAITMINIWPILTRCH